MSATTEEAPGPLGLLAGWGRFPLAIADKCRRAGRPVVCVGLRGLASPELAAQVTEFHWSRVGQLGRMIRCLKRAGVRRAVMAGKVPKAEVLHRPWKALTLLPDCRLVLAWWRHLQRRDNRDDAVMQSFIAEFARDGIQFASVLDVCPEMLVTPGVLTRRRPTAAQERDIGFGWRLAREMGRLDVGQSVAVKELAAIAVEAIEGTDRMILRAGELCRAGDFVVVKVAKPQQDMRFDVPAVGTSTIETMRRAGGRVLAIEADRTILLDPEATVALADRYGIALVALTEAEAGRLAA